MESHAHRPVHPRRLTEERAKEIIRLMQLRGVDTSYHHVEFCRMCRAHHVRIARNRYGRTR